jgi:hypothetical protein
LLDPAPDGFGLKVEVIWVWTVIFRFLEEFEGGGGEEEREENEEEEEEGKESGVFSFSLEEGGFVMMVVRKQGPNAVCMMEWCEKRVMSRVTGRVFMDTCLSLKYSEWSA